jgi:hydrogenase maturation protein HypF
LHEAAGAYVIGGPEGDATLDDGDLWAGLLRDAGRGTAPGVMALRFHAGLARAFATRAARLVETGEARAVALTGGCFQNTLLLDLTRRALGDLPVLHHRDVPANDGSLALGQSLIAMAAAMRRLRRSRRWP